MKKFLAFLLNLAITIFEKSCNEHFRRTSREQAMKNVHAAGYDADLSIFRYPSPEGSIDLKFSLDKPGEIAIKRIPSIFSTNWRLRVFNFTASAKTEHARVLTCQKNNQPTKKERKGKNKH